MKNSTIHIFGGTHGNERLGIHLIQALKNKEISFQTNLNLVPILANPKASHRNSRYIDCDLNRQYQQSSYTSNSSHYEKKQVKKLYEQYNNVDFLIDLHSTTSNMGNSIIVTKWTPFIFKICKFILNITPNTFILYENTLEGSSESLSHSAITLEIGPVGQGVITNDLFNHYKQVIQNILHAIEKTKLLSRLPEHSLPIEPINNFCYYHRTPFKIDYPRDSEGYPQALIHPSLENQNYKPLTLDQPIFIDHQNKNLTLDDLSPPLELLKNIQDGKKMCPIFIGEAAYIEKSIAFIIVEQLKSP